MGKIFSAQGGNQAFLIAAFAICTAFLLGLQNVDLSARANSSECKDKNKHKVREQTTHKAKTPGAAASADANTVPVLVLTQKHSYLGDNRITIAEGAIRMQNLGRMGFVLVAKKPDWKVSIYRTDDKTIFTESLAQFADTGLCSDMLSSRHDRNFEGNQLITVSKLGHLASKRASRDGRVIEYLPLGQFAPQVENILFAAYKTPTNGGIPLYFSKQNTGKDWLTGIDDKNKHQELLATESVKTECVSPSYFATPAGLSRVKAAQEVICSKANRAGADDFGDLFAIGKRQQ